MGSFHKFGKAMFKIPKKKTEASSRRRISTISLDEVKKWILAQDKTLLLKRKNLRQRNQQRRRNKFFT
jgi:DNA topoisomerase-1